jgi:hypothetical protein
MFLVVVINNSPSRKLKQVATFLGICFVLYHFQLYLGYVLYCIIFN